MKKTAQETIKIVRPGRKVANALQGNISLNSIEKILIESKLSPETIVSRLRLIFQPDRVIQEVIVPHFPSFLKLISSDEMIIYKGVSFNPFVGTFGENVNLLDFYSWMKGIIGARPIVLDASWYAVVNMAKRPLVEIFSPKAAEEAVEFFKREKGKYPEVKLAADTREKYLRAASATLFPPSKAPLVLSAEELFGEPEYPECLQEAIKFCADHPPDGKKLAIVRYASYQRYGAEFQRWYTVLVLAEALYLNRVCGVNIKLGPTSESNFDSVIKSFMNKLEIPFGFVWYNRQIENQIPYPDRLFFSDSKDEIRRKLSSSPLLQQWTREILESFIDEEEDLVSATLSVIRRINRVAEKKVTRLGIQGGWFMEFSSGECD